MHVGQLVSGKKIIKSFNKTSKLTSFGAPIYVSKNNIFKAFLFNEQEYTVIHDIDDDSNIWKGDKNEN